MASIDRPVSPSPAHAPTMNVLPQAVMATPAPAAMAGPLRPRRNGPGSRPNISAADSSSDRRPHVRLPAAALPSSATAFPVGKRAASPAAFTTPMVTIAVDRPWLHHEFTAFELAPLSVPFAVDAKATASVSVPNERRWDRVTAYGEPVIDGVAAGLSGWASRLTGGSSWTTGVAAASYSLWASEGFLRETGNALHSKTLSVANVLNSAAGIVGLPTVFGATVELGMASSVLWAGSGALRIARAVADTNRGAMSRVLEGASGMATIGAAALSSSSTEWAATDPARAGRLATWSAGAWFGSAVFGAASVALSRVGVSESVGSSAVPEV